MMIRRISTPIVIVALYAGLTPPYFGMVAQTTEPRGLGLHQPVSHWPEKAKRWALIIGVDQYKDRQIAPLRGADNDARLLAEALIQNAGFPRDQVIVLSTDQPEERQPTRVNILRRLSNLVGAVPTDGLLLVSFAGHGIERREQAFLLPSDAAVSDDIAFLEDTAVSVSRMTDRIAATGVSQVIVLLDACRNDPVGRSDTPNRLTPAFTKFNFDDRNRGVAAFAILYATAVGKRAYEYGEKRQGYFTWAVTEGLKGTAANANGQVTLGGLIDYVQRTVSKRVLIDMGVGSEQRPFADVKGYRASELIISVVERASAGPKGSDGPAPIDPLSIELAFWNSINSSVNREDFRAYLKEYPNGRFANLARNRLSSLEAAGKPSSTEKADPKGPKGRLADIENPLLIGYRTVSNSTTNLNLAADAELGNRLAAMIEKGAKLVTDSVVIEYVNRVGQNIIQHSDSKITSTIKILDTLEINACAFPGYLYITKGAILAANTEAELAGVMAHGIAHTAAGHLVDQGQAGAPSRSSGSSVPIGFFVFGPEAEAQADTLAVQYAWAAGYDPNNVLSFFEKVRERERLKPGITSKLFGSHPPTADRIEKARDLIRRFPDRDEYTVTSSDFNRTKSRLFAITDPKQLDTMVFGTGPRRPTLKRRKEGVDPNQPRGAGAEHPTSKKP